MRDRTKVARMALLGLTFLTTVISTVVFARVLASNSLSIIDVAQLFLFVCLFAFVAFSFWSVLAGLFAYPRPTTPVKRPAGERCILDPKALAENRIAILFPIYNEDPARVFAGVDATIKELDQTGISERFDIFVLSDTRRADTWVTEEQCWQAAIERNRAYSPAIYYRRRRENKARKSGNVEDFVMRFGGAYETMIVYDADSLMSGPTIAEMVRRMDVEPDLGILQAPPRPVNHSSLFARLQQYAAAVYGPVFSAGLRLWTENDGNYWGHNAAIRIRPFADHCGLPSLPGKPPLGGEILSHDFVEAALMRKAGFKVRLAEDLDGSYEECPTTLIDFAKRDQRWCQGNLQHSVLVLRQGLNPVSRAHLFMGILSFVAAPLWGLFILFGIAGVLFDLYVYNQSPDFYTHPWASIGVFTATMLMLVIPKIIGAVHASGRRREKYNGFGLFFSTVLETLISVIVAPIFMAFHTSFVLATLSGWVVEWGTQTRNESGTGFKDAVHAHGIHTIAGVILALITHWLTPDLFWWLMPVFIGLMLSIPISMVISSVELGRFTRRLGLFMIPEEVQVPRVLQRLHEAKPYYTDVVQKLNDTDPLTHLMRDKALLDLHVEILSANTEYDTRHDEVHERECGLAFHGGTNYLTQDDKERLLQSPASLILLHNSLHTKPPSLRAVTT